MLADGIVQFAGKLPPFFILQCQKPGAKGPLREFGPGARRHLIRQQPVMHKKQDQRQKEAGDQNCLVMVERIG